MPNKTELRQKWDNAGKNVVVLHQFDRARDHPNPSMYPIKLETYFRMADIQYVNDFDQPLSKKGKNYYRDCKYSEISIFYVKSRINDETSD